MIKFIKDLYNFFRLKKNETSYKIGFFSENNFIFEYLEPYILNKLKKTKVLILTFEKIEISTIDKNAIFVFHTNFFRELVFLTIRLKFLYSSTPDLNRTIFKKSKLSKCKYIYLHHSPVSLTLIYRPDAFDNFDAVQVISTYQFEEMKEIVSKNKLNTKIFKSKYLFVEKQIKKNKIKNPTTDVLICPTWNSNFYNLNCHILLKDILLKYNISFKLRPHPMSFKKKEISKHDLQKLNIEIDDSKLLNFNNYNFLISDWSGIFIEYAIIFKRKVFLINTPKKIVNKNYTEYKNKPAEITLRNILGKSYDIRNIENIIDEILTLKKNLNNKDKIEDPDLKKIIKDNFY